MSALDDLQGIDNHIFDAIKYIISVDFDDMYGIINI